MRYVGEREVCYDPTELGFPSISACHAVVYVAPAGLFGFHNLGNERATDWPGLTGAWGQFVTGHVSGGGTGSALYGFCYPLTKRGYTGIQKAQWLAELVAFAKGVGFTGPIYGYDLADSGIQGSAYVSFSHVQGKCVIQARQWVHGEDTAGPNTAPSNHKSTRRGEPLFSIVAAPRATVSIGLTAAKTYYPEKLR